MIAVLSVLGYGWVWSALSRSHSRVYILYRPFFRYWFDLKIQGVNKKKARVLCCSESYCTIRVGSKLLA